MNTAESLLATFIDKPRPCLSVIKGLTARSETMSLEDGIQLEIHAFTDYVQNFPFVKDSFERFRLEKSRKMKC